MKYKLLQYSIGECLKCLFRVNKVCVKTDMKAVCLERTEGECSLRGFCGSFDSLGQNC